MRRGSPLGAGLALLLLLPMLGSTAVAADDPPIPHRVSWLGETLLPEDAAHSEGTTWPTYRRWVQNHLSGIWVDPLVADGRVFTNSVSDEGQHEAGVYQHDPAKGALRPTAWLQRQGTGGSVVTGDEKYFYADVTRDGGQLLVRYQRATPAANGSIPISEFPGGDPLHAGKTAGRKLSGLPGGVSTGRGFVFLTRPQENTIYVYERERMTVVAKTTVQNPGALAFRAGSNTLYALSDNASGARVLSSWTVQASGALTAGSTLTDVGGAPVAVAVNANRLVIADNAAAAQQVRVYEDCVSCVDKLRLVDRLGQPGGLAAGGGVYANDRFDNLTAVGLDRDGHIHVGSNSTGAYGWVDIRRFTPAKALQAKLINYIHSDNVVPDPRDPGTVYSAYHKYSLDYTRTTPGQEWAPERTRQTLDRAGCPDDARDVLPNNKDNYQNIPAAVRYLKGADGVERKYLYAIPVAGGYTMGVYRFDGEIARPSVLFSVGMNDWPNGTPGTAGLYQKWVDGGGEPGQPHAQPNCRIDPGEISTMTGRINYIGYGTSIDDKGGIWGGGVGGKPKTVFHFKVDSFDRAHNPRYADGREIELPEVPMDRILQVHYVAATDTAYLYGRLGAEPAGGVSPRYILAAYKGFSTAAPSRSWSVDMGYQSCWSNGRDYCFPQALAVAGNRVYVADQGTTPVPPNGRIRSYRADDGRYQGSLYSGTEIGQTAGLVDIAVTGITATRLPSGDHVIFREDNSVGRVQIHRHTPVDR
ncbi:lactonase family protein [Crossiella cryophila]|uniref:Uncharacterized protein n=1 Tax=Crossiella cryophila TaxID=43355 RepID=A0A7W7FUV8_9PSEU|nr:hypothetical protein [Crossiella cryophila]MBB4679761.1 hypothetical protein [Crossiella cryophila]